ncbi:MAG: hypothetical protein ABIH34_01200 [Nanoarchaeota archaeon]
MKKKQAWIISVDMGYGHQRAAYPLKDIAFDRIITANSDKIVTPKEAKTWRRFRSSYELVSRLRSVPFIGKYLWKSYDKLQSIASYYPLRDLSKPNWGTIYLHNLLKKGFLSSVVEYTKKEEIPFVSTFFAPALAAAHAKRKEVYCVVTDTDINRIWAPSNPKEVDINYFTPTEHSTKRLQAYGIEENRIFFTGFPLPKENTGPDMSILKRDLGYRLPNLDPKKIYLSRYRDLIRKELGGFYKTKSNHPLTLTYTVGGAGAQMAIGDALLYSLQHRIRKHQIRVNLVAGTRPDVSHHFTTVVEHLKLGHELDHYINIMYAPKKKDHFARFNALLHETDILWTKPSELVFYVALGIPLIIAPPLGAHEITNAQWLIRMGSGIQQEDPHYVNEWLFEWLDRGLFAEAAFEGFIEAPKYGTYNIEKVLFSKNKKNLRFKA